MVQRWQSVMLMGTGMHLLGPAADPGSGTSGVELSYQFNS